MTDLHHRHEPVEVETFGTVCNFCNDQWPCDAAVLAAELAAAREEARRARLVKGVLVDVAAERARQVIKWGEQNHPDGTGPGVTIELPVTSAYPLPVATGRTLEVWARHRCKAAPDEGGDTYERILTEEWAEVIASPSGSEALRAELVQVAAVAVAWAEKLDRERRAALSGEGAAAQRNPCDHPACLLCSDPCGGYRAEPQSGEGAAPRRCDWPACPGRSADLPMHEIETGPELHDECKRLLGRACYRCGRDVGSDSDPARCSPCTRKLRGDGGAEITVHAGRSLPPELTEALADLARATIESASTPDPPSYAVFVCAQGIIGCRSIGHHREHNLAEQPFIRAEQDSSGDAQAVTFGKGAADQPQPERKHLTTCEHLVFNRQCTCPVGQP